MQINLKQTEIVAALKQYISTQGINLAGKDVKITFTAGRKEAGLVADVVIEDLTGVQIVGSTDSKGDDAKAPAPVVPEKTPDPVVPVADAASAASNDEGDNRPLGQLPAAETKVAGGTSLFS